MAYLYCYYSIINTISYSVSIQLEQFAHNCLHMAAEKAKPFSMRAAVCGFVRKTKGYKIRTGFFKEQRLIYFLIRGVR